MQTQQMQIARFACDTTPYALYSFNMEEDNQEFLNSIDPDYYLHISRTNAEALETNERHYAAIQLRTAYSQAIETLFILLATATQAPDCPVGWTLCFHTADLYNVVRKIQNSVPIFTRLKSNPVTWTALAHITLPLDIQDEAKLKETQAAFAKFWGDLAYEWLQKEFTEEYNSVKHGLRTRMHGYHLAMELENSPGVPAPAGNMVTIASSEFGLHFFSTKEISNKHNLKLVRVRRNWHPKKFALTLQLIAASIHNVLTFLKSIQGIPSDQLQTQIPEDLNSFNSPLGYHLHSGSMRWSPIIDPAAITPLSKQEILAYYSENEEAEEE